MKGKHPSRQCNNDAVTSASSGDNPLGVDEGFLKINGKSRHHLKAIEDFEMVE